MEKLKNWKLSRISFRRKKKAQLSTFPTSGNKQTMPPPELIVITNHSAIEEFDSDVDDADTSSEDYEAIEHVGAIVHSPPTKPTEYARESACGVSSSSRTSTRLPSRLPSSSIDGFMLEGANWTYKCYNVLPCTDKDTCTPPTRAWDQDYLQPTSKNQNSPTKITTPSHGFCDNFVTTTSHDCMHGVTDNTLTLSLLGQGSDQSSDDLFSNSQNWWLDTQ